MNDKTTLLMDELKRFTEKSHSTDANSKELIDDFRAIAKAIICGGYILVNAGDSSHKIYIDVLEFYFHNEWNGIKDYAMYHRNKIDAADKDKNTNTDLKYYKIGEINMHMSGFDITFENEDKGIRASALIRAYRCVPCDNKWDDANIKTEYHSTYLYNDLLKGMSIIDGISIKWIDDASDNRSLNPDSYPRKNIKQYSSEGEKLETKACDRKWRIALDGIKIQ